MGIFGSGPEPIQVRDPGMTHPLISPIRAQFPRFRGLNITYSGKNSTIVLRILQFFVILGYRGLYRARKYPLLAPFGRTIGLGVDL